MVAVSNDGQIAAIGSEVPDDLAVELQAAVASVLGHSSPRMVESTYAHAASREANRVAEGIGALLSKAGRPAAQGAVA